MSFTNDNDSDDLTAPHQRHLLPPSTLIELVDWPSAMPTTHVPDVNLVITFRALHPASLNTTHVRTCARLSSSTRGSSRLTYASLKAVGQQGEALSHPLIFAMCSEDHLHNLIRQEQ